VNCAEGNAVPHRLSIGAFLSQVVLMANQKNLFSDSRLFMFCGGSIFRSMFGVSRSIMPNS